MYKKHSDKSSTRGRPDTYIRRDTDAKNEEPMDTADQADGLPGWKASETDPVVFSTGHQNVHFPSYAGTQLRRDQQADCQGRGTDHLLLSTSHQGFQDSCYERTLLLKQKQLQRSIEASKQMLYGVFGNVITILEEFEKRELANNRIKLEMPRSDIYIPEQGHKTFADIKSNVETQLLFFDKQTKACPPEAIAEVLDELKRKTLSWSAVREEMGIEEIYQTDTYITQLYEILAKGSTDHKPIDRQKVTEKVMREGFQAMLKGQHERATLDKEFKTNPDKKANTPKTRGSEQIHDGAKRIARARGDRELDGYLEQDIKNLEQQGPQDLK